MLMIVCKKLSYNSYVRIFGFIFFDTHLSFFANRHDQQNNGRRMYDLRKRALSHLYEAITTACIICSTHHQVGAKCNTAD